MQSAELRQAFLQFFADREHRTVPSASLVPGTDRSLLFTNAGMVPFKDVFLGREKPPAPNAVSVQKCLRAGGKHNDLDNVGYTARHHTFFEMLGNFSFGGYFKQQAIAHAWEFLTEVAGLPADRLWVSVHRDDAESAAIWRDQIGVPTERLLHLGDEDNFWSMADTGPCGPCSEIYFDHGEQVPGGLPGSGQEGDRWVEIWNLVFMQYDRQQDGSQTELPRPCVDTGMGLERLVAAVQGQVSNFDTDLFVPLMEVAARQLGCEQVEPEKVASLKVIADHLRALGFLIADGVLPANEGRGYVLRRILRRAARHGYRLGASEPFLHLLVPALVGQLGEAYPELSERSERIARTIADEEGQFSQALERGMQMLKDHLKANPGAALPGEMVFLLHDTYGFPVDMSADFAREQGIGWDEAGYEREMQRQREMSRATGSFQSEHIPGLDGLDATHFSGYEQLEDSGEVQGLWSDGKSVQVLQAGQRCRVALDRSPFYAEAGGQIGDTGVFRGPGCAGQVLDCVLEGGIYLHDIALDEGELQPGTRLELRVDAARRTAIMRNHSATHLLHAALRQVLGSEVEQRGSWVGPDRLRFDFSHKGKMTPEQTAQVEALVSEQVLANTQVQVRHMGREDALQAGAVALFGEKYGDQVRVLNMGGEFSVELCGGTHVLRTGDIGPFRILSDSSVSAGVRRIEAITGTAAIDWYRRRAEMLEQVAAQLKCGADEVTERLQARLEKSTDRGEVSVSYSVQFALGDAQLQVTLAEQVESVHQLRDLRHSIDKLASRVPGSSDADFRVLAAPLANGEAAVLAMVEGSWQDRLGANQVVAWLAGQFGGKGGGKKDFAQAGGGDANALSGALGGLSDWLKGQLG